MTAENQSVKNSSSLHQLTFHIEKPEGLLPQRVQDHETARRYQSYVYVYDLYGLPEPAAKRRQTFSHPETVSALQYQSDQ